MGKVISCLGFGAALFLGFSRTALADVGTLSRANCIVLHLTINESVTYDRPLLRVYDGLAGSAHTQQGNIEPYHDILFSEEVPSWRHYAGDTDDPGVMTVTGYHTWHFYDPVVGTSEWGYRTTTASDCNLTEW